MEKKRSKSILPGEKIVIVDDVIATGGTLKAIVDLIKKLGGKMAGISGFIELKDLKGREKLRDYKLHSLIKLIKPVTAKEVLETFAKNIKKIKKIDLRNFTQSSNRKALFLF